MNKTIHNPDQYMSDLRQILAQGRKRLGILVGAGAPVGILIDPQTGKMSLSGKPLIPDVAGLTTDVIAEISKVNSKVIKGLAADLGGTPNIEQILSRVRTLAEALGGNKIHEMDGKAYEQLGKDICAIIGKVVCVSLPKEQNPYSELAGWIGGTARDHAIEIFTPNYDLLMEEAFEVAHIPFFDGFSGSREPFFDPATIANSDLPSRWARLWKLHGSLGWDLNEANEIVRRQGNNATQLIYPTHLKYDQTQKLPYTALIDRLRKFLMSPDSLLLTTGFSFSDAHLTAVIDESLSANRGAAVIALHFGKIEKAVGASRLALRRANISVYAQDGAIINCIQAPWQPGELPHPAWGPIRASFWGKLKEVDDTGFLLGDFSAFARYVAMTRAEHAEAIEAAPVAKPA
jgi:hypothetical protein